MKNAIWLFILAIFVLFCFLPSYTQMQDLKQKNKDYLRQIAVLENKQERMLEENRLLKEDPVYLEKVAREKMGLIREGEVVFKIEERRVEDDAQE